MKRNEDVLKKKPKRLPRKVRYPNLEVEEILAWADAHRARTGKWPTTTSGRVVGAPGNTWHAIDSALNKGNRGLTKGPSLAKLLVQYRQARNRTSLPALSEEQILAWADAHFERTGDWPTTACGAVVDAPGENWRTLSHALEVGARTLPGGSSLAQLLAKHRGVRNHSMLPPYTEEQILSWCDSYFERYGRWPKHGSGAIAEAPGETWMAVEMALTKGRRGITRKTSLAQLLAERRSVPHALQRPKLDVEQILAWSDAHYARTGKWPTIQSGEVESALNETWVRIDHALRRGLRGIHEGGSSLAMLLQMRRGRPHRAHPDTLTVEQILSWADTYHAQTGRWPKRSSGLVEEAWDLPLTWALINASLIDGRRGLTKGASLAQLLAARRGVRNPMSLPNLSEEKILLWADAYHARHSCWPTQRSGPIEEAPEETWTAINNALSKGTRGLTRQTSLARLLEEQRGRRNPVYPPDLTVEKILEWADAYHARTGRWPSATYRQIVGSDSETWRGIDSALRSGYRGLAGGSSLAKLLDTRRRAEEIHEAQ